MAEGDLDQVISLSTSALEDKPDDVQPRIYMVTSAASEEEWELVDKIVEETLASDLESGQKSQFLHQISQSVSDVGEFDRARGYVDRAIAMAPDRTEHSKNTIAWIDARCGRLEEAQDYYRQAMEEGQTSTGGYGLMYVALRRQDYAEAVKIGQQLLDSGPETANIMRYMATAFAEQKKFREALPYAERAVAMDDGYASQSILAWTLVAGDIDVDRGAEIADDTADGRLHPEQSRWKFAEFPSPEHSLGLALLKSGETEEAVEVLEMALMRRPDRMLIAEDLRRAKEAL
jgi:tetratricopeptide (TPR) repeat protein